MFNRQYISKMFYIHRELGMAVAMLVAAAMELIAGVIVGNPWQYLAWAFAAALALIAAVLVINVIRFEKKYPTSK